MLDLHGGIAAQNLQTNYHILLHNILVHHALIRYLYSYTAEVQTHQEATAQQFL